MKSKYADLYFDIEKMEEWITLWGEINEHEISSVRKEKVAKRERYHIDVDGKGIMLDLIECKGGAYTISPKVGKHPELSEEIAEYVYKRVSDTLNSAPCNNGFSVLLERENLDVIIDLISSEGAQIVEKREQLDEKPCKIMYRINGIAGDQIVITYYLNTNRMQVQGKKKMLFETVLSLVSEISDDINDVVDQQLRCYSVDVTRNDIYEEMEAVLETSLYKFLSTAHKAMLSFAFVLSKVNFETDDYSPIVQQAIRSFEGFAKKIFTECGLTCDGKTQLGYFFKDNDMKEEYSKIISAEQQNMLTGIYKFYRENRHDYMHASAYDFDAKVIGDRAIADELFHRILSSMKSWHSLHEELK